MKYFTSKHTDYILIIILTLLLLMHLHQISTFDFQSPQLLQNLNQWENKEGLVFKLLALEKLNKQVEDLTFQLNQLIDEQNYIFQKIKDGFIQDNRELQDIPEVHQFHKKLTTFLSIQARLNQQSQKTSKLIHRIQGIKKQKGKIDMIILRELIKEASEKLELQRDEIHIIVDKNKKWREQSQSKLPKKPETNQAFIDQDIEDLPQYYNLAPLAKEVLKPMPLDLLKTLYKSTSLSHQQSQLQIRQKYYKQRVYIANYNNQIPSFSLTKYNIRSAVETQYWEEDILSDYSRLEAKYSFGQYPNQKSICIVVPTYNNAKNFRAQINLNSIFSQNYTNYKVVIIDDYSKDATPIIIKKYLDFYNIPKQKCQLIINKANKKALSNIYYAIMNNCQQQQIVTIVDGDDQLIGYNVLKVLNAVYSQGLFGVVYSNFYFYKQDTLYVNEGFSSQYNSSEQEDYRSTKQKFSHLISFKRQLFREIKLPDLQQNGQFYSVAYDYAMLYPLLELSCKRVKYVSEFQYLYSIGTGMNDYQILKQEQKEVSERILKKAPYSCSKKYQN